MSKHFTITIRVNEVVVTPAEAVHYGQTPTKSERVVHETADVTVRAETKEEALEKLSIIIPAL